MENNKQVENKKDNLNQFDLDVYAGTIYGTSWSRNNKKRGKKSYHRDDGS